MVLLYQLTHCLVLPEDGTGERYRKRRVLFLVPVFSLQVPKAWLPVSGFVAVGWLPTEFCWRPTGDFLASFTRAPMGGFLAASPGLQRIPSHPVECSAATPSRSASQP